MGIFSKTVVSKKFFIFTFKSLSMLEFSLLILNSLTRLFMRTNERCIVEKVHRPTLVKPPQTVLKPSKFPRFGKLFY